MRSAFAVVVSVAAGAIVLYTISSANGNVREATAIRVQLKAA